MDSNLRKWRKNNRFTLKDAARLFGTNEANLSLIERGLAKPTFNLYASIHKLTGGKIGVNDFKYNL